MGCIKFQFFSIFVGYFNYRVIRYYVINQMILCCLVYIVKIRKIKFFLCVVRERKMVFLVIQFYGMCRGLYIYIGGYVRKCVLKKLCYLFSNFRK